MEEQQNAELAPVAPQQPVVEAPAASVPTQEVKKEYVSNEPRHPLMDVLDKAQKKAEEAKKAEAAKVPEVKPIDPALAPKAAESFDLNTWDGNVAALPEKLKKIVSDNQAAFTKKAQEAAEVQKKYDELNGMVQKYIEETHSEDSQLFSPEEFEAAQLDPQKFLDLTSRVAQHIVDREKKQLEPMISQVQFNQQVVENERKINDFATKNTDFWDLYDAGILEPFVKSHGLEKGYEMAASIKGKFTQAAISASQSRIQEKKNATSATPTPSQAVEVVYVDSANDVTPTAMQYAAQGKKVKVRVRPRS